MPFHMTVFLIFFWAAHARADILPLALPGWQALTFEAIPATAIQKRETEWLFSVNRSASAEVLPLLKAEAVREVSFDWYTEGPTETLSKGDLRSKEGDDALLRVGLILSGEAPLVPFFAPAWVKKLAEILHLPTASMLYLTPGTGLKDGSVFASPYTDSIRTIAVGSQAGETPWQHVRVVFPQAKEVVGLWLMADGDNSASTFVTHLRNLQLRSF